MSSEPFITAYPPDWSETRNWMAEAAKLTGKRWPAESIRIDLRYWQDQCLRPGAKAPALPSCRTLAEDWGVGKSTASRYLADVDWWTDERKREAWDRWYLAEVWRLPVYGPTHNAALAGRGTPVGHWRDAGGTDAGQDRDRGSRGGADREDSAGHQRDGDGTQAGQDRDSGGDTRVGSTIHNPQSTEDNNSDPHAARTDTRPPLVLIATAPEADEPEAASVPPWAGKVAAAAKSGGRKVKPAEVVAAFVEALTALRDAPVNPARCATDATPLAALWRAEGFPPLAEFVADAALVGKAARESKSPLFARDIRAEGWAEGVDRSRSVATLTVQARWQDRVRAARAEFGGAASTGATPPATNPTTPSPGAEAWADMLTRPHVAAPFPEFIGWIARSPAQWADPRKVKLATDPAEHARRLRAFAGPGALGMRWENDHKLPELRERIRLDFIARYEATP